MPGMNLSSPCFFTGNYALIADNSNENTVFSS